MCDPSEVHSRFTFWDKSVPKLGLVEDATYDYRVYALALAHDCTYVGIAHKSDVKRAVNRHFDGSGKTHYTRVHPPKRVLLVWPAISPAAEAFVYYAFLSRMNAGASQATQFKIGGWVQTSSKLSPVSSMVQEEARRQLRSECFNCGSRDHYASSCKKPLYGCRYTCDAEGCGHSILITSRGQTPQTKPASPQNAETNSSTTEPPTLTEPPRPAKGRLASVSLPVVEKPAKRRKTEVNASARGGKEVNVLGESYTSLSWFLCSPNPTPREVRIAKQYCSENALELQGCHTRALDDFGFTATPPARSKSLSGERERLGRTFVDSELQGLRIRRSSDGKLACRLSQVLFRVADLRKAFGN